MVIVKLIGGLGNQLFQYATGRALAAHHGVEIAVDISGMLDETGTYFVHREYGLGAFACDPIVVEAAESEQYPTYQARSFTFDPGLFTAPKDTLLSGYWQTERYFKPIESTLRSDLRFKEPLQGESLEIAELIGSTRSVSMHVRRGDYLDEQNRTFGVCGLVYYHRAARMVAEGLDAPHFFVFSDDVEWAAANIRPGFPTTVVQNNNGDGDHIDLQLMSLCNHNIIANSTFSWWGAWLNSSPDRRVIGPSPWFRDPNLDTSDVMPSDWQKLATS